jgi:hypothetical protein
MVLLRYRSQCGRPCDRRPGRISLFSLGADAKSAALGAVCVYYYKGHDGRADVATRIEYLWKWCLHLRPERRDARDLFAHRFYEARVRRRGSKLVVRREDDMLRMYVACRFDINGEEVSLHSCMTCRRSGRRSCFLNFFFTLYQDRWTITIPHCEKLLQL